MTSDIVNQAVESATRAVDSVSALISPTSIYVPPFVSSAARVLREAVTSRMGSYRLLYVDLHSLAFWQAFVVIFLQPMIWNCVGRLEHRTRVITRLCFNRPRLGVGVLALWIFLAGLYRDVLFNIAVQRQQSARPLDQLKFQALGCGCVAFGAVLVLSSFARLGFAGTYLGDYFGILMDSRVTKFPFNILDDPMYDGSTLIFFGKAVLSKSMAGVLLSMWVYAVYRIAALFEGEFTAYVYSKKAEDEKKTKEDNKEKTS